MTGAREEILARIRAAGGAGSSAEVDAAYAALERRYLRAHHDPGSTNLVALFAERAAHYRAIVERVPAVDIPVAISRAVAVIPPGVPTAGVPTAGAPTAEAPTAGAAPRSGPLAAGVVRVLVPDGLPADWLGKLTAGIELVRDSPTLAAGELDLVSGVVTGCAAAIAETGTVILDHGPGQGRRALTLVPDFHLVIVLAEAIAADLPDALARLDPTRPQTLVSGPSATSDIELIRVEGVHGPRTLHILIAE